MTIIPNQSLFMGTEVRVRFSEVLQQGFDHINAMSDEEVLSKSTEELAAAFANQYKQQVPTINASECEMSVTEGYVDQYPYPNPNFRQIHSPKVRGNTYTFHVPYQGDRSYLYLKPSVYPVGAPTAATTDSEILIGQSGAWLTPEAIDKECDRPLALIQDFLARLTREVETFNATLGGEFRRRIEARRLLAEKNRQTTANLKYPMRKRADAPPPPAVPVIRPKIVSKPPPVPAAPTADPVLLEDHYQHTLRICEQMSAVMERSPAAFATMGEEHIRFHFLMQLNAQYEGEALGEAFNLGGKTDILVRHQGHNLFIAECKFWDGPKSLTDTVDQLFGYVTWRDTKTAIIMFSDRKSFSGVIAEAEATLAQHPNIVGVPKKEGDSRFRCTFKLPSDPSRHVVVTVLLFNIPKPDGN